MIDRSQYFVFCSKTRVFTKLCSFCKQEIQAKKLEYFEKDKKGYGLICPNCANINYLFILVSNKHFAYATQQTLFKKQAKIIIKNNCLQH